MVITATIKKSFRASLAKRLWAFYFIAAILSGILNEIVQIPLNVYSQNLSVQFQEVLLQQSLAGASQDAVFQTILPILIDFILQSLPFLVLTFIIVTLLSLLVEAVMVGMRLHGAREFLKGNHGISNLLETSFAQTKPRIKTAFLVALLFSIIASILFLVLFFLFVLPILQASAGELLQAFANPIDSEEAFILIFTRFFAAFSIFLSLFFIMLLVQFLLAPILALVNPVVYFEKQGVIPSIKRAISLGRQKYFRNLLLLIVFGLTLTLALTALMVLFFIGLVTIIGLLVVIPLTIVFIFWMFAYTHVFAVNYYELASGNLSTMVPAKMVSRSPTPRQNPKNDPLYKKIRQPEKRKPAAKKPVKKPVRKK
jgi:hypothetical protein